MAPTLIFAALALLSAGAASAREAVPAGEVQYVSFPSSYVKTVGTGQEANGFEASWRLTCLNWCYHHDGHHSMTVIPTRVLDTASVLCSCCPRDPTSGGCFSTTHPYSASSVYGPTTWATGEVALKMNPRITNITTASIEAAPIPQLGMKPTTAAVGTTVEFIWPIVQSQKGLPTYAHFVNSKGADTVVELDVTKYTAKVPAGLSGTIKVTISSAPNALTNLYTIAGPFTFTIPSPQVKKVSKKTTTTTTSKKTTTTTKKAATTTAKKSSHRRRS